MARERRPGEYQIAKLLPSSVDRDRGWKLDGRFPKFIRGLSYLLLCAFSLGLLEIGTAGADASIFVPVLVTTVHYTQPYRHRTLPGVIRARVESDLGFRVSGKLIRRLVDVGEVVQPGQSLIELDPVDLVHNMASAEAELRAARAEVGSAEAERERIAVLRQRGWSTPSDLDRQRAVAENAHGRLDRAQQAFAMARNALGYGTLKADAVGVVTAILAEPGQVIAVGQTVLRVAQFQHRDADVAIPEMALKDLQTDSAVVSLWAFPERQYPARLRQLSPSADPVTRTYNARFDLPTADADVMLGMTATVTLTKAGPSLARLPLAAVIDTGTGPSVWVVDSTGTRIAGHAVQVAQVNDDSVLVSSGVSEGDRVVALGVQKLDAETRVRIVRQSGR